MTHSTFSDDYIVRIYRYNNRKAHRFVGTIEEVGTEGKQAFETIDELWNIISRKKSSRREPKEKTKKSE